MANDVTYLYFKREFGEDNGGPMYSAPMIRHTRVVHPGHRSGSVPPITTTYMGRQSSMGGANYALGGAPTAYRRASVSVPSGSAFRGVRGGTAGLYGGGGYSSVSTDDYTDGPRYHSTTSHHPKNFGRHSQIDDYDFDTDISMTSRPRHSDDSYSNLRVRADVARSQLGRHRVMLDRYLPLSLGPAPEVEHEVQYKYGELVDRMPQLEQYRTSSSRSEDYSTPSAYHVPPYRPLPTKPKPKSDQPELPPLRKSFTPKISETRKRVRGVICKVRGDPRYFDY